MQKNMLGLVGSFSYLKRFFTKVENAVSKRRKLKKQINWKYRFSDKDKRRIPETIRDGTFSFSPLFPLEIPKPNKPKEFRGLSIPSPKDRVVHKAMLSVLMPQLKSYLNSTPSYGIQRRRGLQSAVKDVSFDINQYGYKYILVADIKKFFDKINREKLINELMRHTKFDSSLNSLIIKVLDVRYSTDPKHPEIFPNDTFGVPQGCALSPLFADLYLKSFDIEMNNHGYKIYRYVDDFALLGKSKRDIYNGYRKARKILKKLDLSIHEYSSPKCFAGSLEDSPVFLGIEIGPSGVMTPCRKGVHKFNHKMGNKIASLVSTKNLEESVMEINYMIDGWKSAYGFCTKKHFVECKTKFNATISLGIQNAVSRNTRQRDLQIICSKLKRF